MAIRLPIRTAEVFVPLLNPARYKGAWGGRGCLHPDALIDTPKGQIKVSEFQGGEVYSWHQGRIVIAQATPAAEFTKEDLFEVVLDDGRSIIATDQHKFLTPDGWRQLSSLEADASVLSARKKFGSYRLRSTSGACPSEFRADARRCLQKLAGCLGDCSGCRRQCGQRPHSAAGSGLAFVPLPNDALLHSFRASSHSDDPACADRHTLSSAFRRLSTWAVLASSALQYCADLGSRIGERISEWPSAFCPSLGLSQQMSFPLAQGPVLFAPVLGLGSRRNQVGNPQMPHGIFARDVQNSFPSCDAFRGCGDFKISKVESIRKHSRLKYWDLHVFGTNNYLSDGIVNHNSGKSHFFADNVAEDALRWPGEAGEGVRIACIREVQKSLKQSAKRLIEDKLQKFGLGEAQGFKCYTDVIATPGDGLITFTGMQDHTADSVKSMEGFHRAWVEEAHSLSIRSLGLLRPTIRWEDASRNLASELWFSWNPERPTDAVDQLLRGKNAPTDAVVVRANWSDNPWFPNVLEQERQDDLKNRPERYGHVWEGDYATVLEGAYYAEHLNRARLENRIAFFAREPLMGVYAVWDIGSTSRKADATAIWIVQYINTEVRVLDYYESRGQDFQYHVNWLHSHGYKDALCVLPHDGVKHDFVVQITPQSYLRSAGFAVETIPNQGPGAAMARVEAARQMFPHVRFNEETTEAGRDALGWYHERIDEKRGVGLGPEHDFASHAADAWGLVAIYRQRVNNSSNWDKPIRRNLKGIA